MLLFKKNGRTIIVTREEEKSTENIGLIFPDRGTIDFEMVELTLDELREIIEEMKAVQIIKSITDKF